MGVTHIGIARNSFPESSGENRDLVSEAELVKVVVTSISEAFLASRRST